MRGQSRFGTRFRGMGMYRPDAFRLDDRKTLLAHANAHAFATVMTQRAAAVTVSHLPLLVDYERSVLRGHVARKNPQFKDLAQGVEALAIFHGPHAYVSPSVYEEQP